jgi:hypothetical protein
MKKTFRGSQRRSSPRKTYKDSVTVPKSTSKERNSGMQSGAIAATWQAQPGSRPLSQPSSRSGFKNHKVGVILVSLLVFILVFAAILGRTAPIIVIDGQIIPPIVEPGQKFIVTRRLTIIRPDCRGNEVEALLIDSVHGLHLLASTNVPPRLVAKTTRTWTVPLGMVGGTAIYRSTVSFSCFPFYSLWPIVVTSPELPDLQFEVRRE